ncbi:mitochondrial carrier homolog 2-like isoform X2 [Cimex lectularius]|nr:mitochondrial carrier homolog 2-like isoform X2 [Cimex lectularius]
MLPNVFQYVKYIKGIDGFTGCYRGFAPKLAGQVVGMFSAPMVVNQLKQELGPDFDFNPTDDELSDEEKITVFKRTLMLDIVGRSISIVVSHPFSVISARMMAEFVGGEQQYSGIFASIMEIYKEQGIGGFFSGLMPRWLGELATLIVSSFLIFGVNNYVIQDRELKVFTIPTLQYITTTMTYPLTVISSCMQVNNCGLAAGMPPHMPIYKNWRSCFSHLSKTGKLHRGSGLFFRYCPSPSPAIGSNPKSKYFF